MPKPNTTVTKMPKLIAKSVTFFSFYLQGRSSQRNISGGIEHTDKEGSAQWRRQEQA